MKPICEFKSFGNGAADGGETFSQKSEVCYWPTTRLYGLW